jgi:hypothetical protein
MKKNIFLHASNKHDFKMNILYCLILIITLLIGSGGQVISSSRASQNGQVTADNKKSFSEAFFDHAVLQLSRMKEYRKLVSKLHCPPSGLDSILEKNKLLKVAGMFLNPVPFLNNDTKFLVFYVKTDKRIEEDGGFDKYQNGKIYLNNMLVFFQMQKDSTYLMTDYLFKPINQGMYGLDYVNIVYNSQNNHLYLQQFGGNPFGKWSSEFEFEFDTTSKKWIHFQSNLYTASFKCCPEYKIEKLVWSRKPLKRLPIEEVNYTDYFKYQELEKLML